MTEQSAPDISAGPRPSPLRRRLLAAALTVSVVTGLGVFVASSPALAVSVFSGNVGIAGATVNVFTYRTTSDANGNFWIQLPDPDAKEQIAYPTITVTPRHPACNFTPAVRSVPWSVNGSVGAINFTAACQILAPVWGNVGVPSVAVALYIDGGPVSSVWSDANGNYSGFGWAGYGLRVWPVHATGGCTFTPPVQSVVLPAAGANVSFQFGCGRISGNVNAAGVNVTAGSYTSTSDTNGNYTLPPTGGMTAATYTVTPSKANCTFTPASRQVTVGSTAISGKNFTASCTPPPGPNIDRSVTLGNSWKCAGQGSVGSRYNAWVKAMVLYAAKTGNEFRAQCNRVRNQSGNSLPFPVRSGVILVSFRDTNNIVKAVGYYDSILDRQNIAGAAGLMPVMASKMTVTVTNQAACATLVCVPGQPHTWTRADINRFFDGLNGVALADLDVVDLYYQLGPAQADRGWTTRYSDLGSCSSTATLCYTASRIRHGGHEDGLRVVISPNGTDPLGVWITGNDDTVSDIIGRIVLVVGYTVVGAGIGLAIGITSAAGLAAFSAAFGTFLGGIASGKDLLSAFLDALKAGALAYVGRFILDKFGDPTAPVGVNGLDSCPTGQGCPILQLLDGFPPIKALAQLHDPFITMTGAAFGNLGTSAFFKAVTIPPFLIPGCAAVATCLTGGIAVGTGNEI